MNRDTLMWMGRRSAAGALALMLFVLPACYERTVSTRGVGGYGTATQKSYRSDTAVDRWYDDAFTKDPPKKRMKFVGGDPATTTNK